MFPKPIVDQRYHAVTCESCKGKILLSCDPNNGDGNIGASFARICPRCRSKGSLEAQHAQHERRKPRSLRWNDLEKRQPGP
jgi:hypothetical protein